MKTFQGRVVAPGQVTAKALVSHGGLNTLASFQNALQFGDKQAKCGDQNNPDLYGKPMVGTALCLPQTIGSTTGGLVLYCAADVWVDSVTIPVVDSLGEEFLDYVKDGMTITVKENGIVEVD